MGERYSEKADVWSLGCVFVEMCTLKAPYADRVVADFAHLLGKLQDGSYSPIPMDTSLLPPPVVDIMRRCFQHDHYERLSARDVLRALEAEEQAITGNQSSRVGEQPSTGRISNPSTANATEWLCSQDAAAGGTCFSDDTLTELNVSSRV